ncbi:hypothetical protein NA57DRAFT_11173, partial [Rhizodiscina lignyota]
DIETEIADLEARLAVAKSRLARQPSLQPPSLSASLHPLLLLADSALPLGSFAFSSGLESYLAHQRLRSPTFTQSQQQQSFQSFLQLSVASLASTALPYVLAAYKEPGRLRDLDNDYDAIILCNVARRASVAQGKGLLSVWERSFCGGYASSSDPRISDAVSAFTKFHQQLRSAPHRALNSSLAPQDGEGSDDWDLPLNAHLAPLWGVLTLILGLSPQDSAYLFLFSHIRTVVSAAVRASVLGPYQAQAVLSSGGVQKLIREKMAGWWDVGWSGKTEEAGQVVPVMDLWVGRHEILYSRIFNS